jgi:tetratricopeptide (TPR) repeat protein
MSTQLRAALLLLAAACSPRAPDRDVPAAATRAPPAAPDPAPAGDARPRPPRCPLEGSPSPRALSTRAEAELDAGASERALACAEEALRSAPRLVPALAARADALAELGRPQEARLAYARALAVDPDDPATLLGAAELNLRRFGGERDALETALEYAVRGARAAARGGDTELASRLELLAGLAENDRGRSARALPRLERVARARPRDPDAAYERGLALFELCRFVEAQRDFERALALAPEDPWALHQLGLVLERRGDPRAASLLARARALAPDELPPELPVDAETFRAELSAAIAALPDEERRSLRGVPVEVSDLPDLADLVAVDPPLSPTILGLYRGPPEGEACLPLDGPTCRSIVLYRKNLIRFARSRGELGEQVRVTLRHEIGHLHGETDDDLRGRGLE